MNFSFTIDAKDFAVAITRAAVGLPSSPQQPIYAGLLLSTNSDMIHLTASDGDARFTSHAACQAEAEGSCVIPGRLLSDISRYFGGDQVSCEYKDDLFRISSGRSRFTLNALDGDAYPGWREDIPVFLRTDGGELARALRGVASSAGDSPAILTGICMETEDGQLMLVCTDRSRMAVAAVPFVKAPADPASFTVLPAKAGERFARECEGEVSAGWNDALILLEAPGVRMTARRIAGKFLPWRNVLRQQPEDGWAAVNVRELTRAVRMAQLAVTGYDWISFLFTEGGLVISSGEQGQECREIVSCSYSGEDCSFDLGAQHVLDGLASCGDTAEMAFTGTDAAVRFFMRDGSFRYMIASRRET